MLIGFVSLLGPALTVNCVNHNKTLRVTSAEDFNKLSPEGGCTNPCNAPLPCGHSCKKLCHILGNNHSNNENCTQPCERSALCVCVHYNHVCNGDYNIIYIAKKLR